MSSAGRVGGLDQLIERLVAAAGTSIAVGNLDQARATAEDIQLVDPDNPRAAAILAEVNRRQRDPGEQRGLMTIFFSDLVESTALADRLEPEVMRDLYRRYREVAKEAIDRFGGYIVQYLGDGIMASFGYPAAHEDDARRAVYAGLALVEGLQALDEFGPDVEPRTRVGIHTGPVVIAGLGASEPKERDSIVGVAPNLAARLQSEAEPGMVVVSDVTKALIDGQFEVTSRGLRQLKGIARSVEVFAVDGVRSVFGRFDASRARHAGLHGRGDATSRLVGAWDEVSNQAAPAGGIVLISGEAGIGKTRLAAEIHGTVSAAGGGVLAAACQPYYANSPLWPIATMMERATGLWGEPDEARLGLLVDYLTGLGIDPANSVALLAPLVDIEDTPGYETHTLDATTRLQETFAVVVDWLTTIAAGRPGLLVVEDLHWSDPTTLGLLGVLASSPPAGLLTVLTTRDETALPWRDLTTHIPLHRFDDDTAAGFVDDLAGAADLPIEVRRSIIDRADGIPLFVEELTCSVVGAPVTPDWLPYRLQELMTGRLKTPEIDLRLAQMAATIGGVFSQDQLVRVAGDGEQVDRALAAMETAGIIDRIGADDEGWFRFRHALMRDAAYETQVLDVRRRTHAAVADAIAQEEEDAAVLAHHLDLADEPARAVPYYIASAQAAEGNGSHIEATRLLTRAIELIDRFPESGERDLSELTARMLRGLNVSSMQGYSSPDVAADHRRVEALTQQLGQRPEVVPSLIGIWAYWLTSGDHETARRIIRRIRSLVEDPALAMYRPEASACLGFQSLYYDRLDRAKAELESAMDAFSARPEAEAQAVFWPLPNDAIAVTAVALATVAALQGDLERAATWERTAYQRVDTIGSLRGPFSRAFVNTYAAFIRRIANDDAAARSLAAETIAIGTEYGYTYWVMIGSIYQMAATPDEDPDPEYLAAAIDALRDIGHHAFVASNLAGLAEIRASRGDLGGALEAIDDALITADKTGEVLHRPELLRRRVAHRRDLVGPAPGDVRELIEAYDLAVARDIHIVALRAAIDLARLPKDERPVDWRVRLEEALLRVPADSPASEAAEANAI
ncbi:MAG: AAA family ATPase, partial [Acidimicrobiia bacterium]|nr:AAA family ATPase [Acidimicrobiia bacterium]